MLRVAVIGVGAMGKHHARVYNELPGVELVGVADINNKAVRKVAKEYKTQVFTNYRKLLDESLDAVSVCVPTSLHKKVALDVIKSRTNLLVEKPIAATVREAREIISAAKRKKLVLQVGHIERFNPVVNVIKRAMKGEKVISIDIIRVGPHPPRVRDVGVVVDIGTHDIDLIRYLSRSDFKEINAVIASPKSEFEDAAVLSFKLKSGTIASVVTNRLTPFKVRGIKVATKSKLIHGDLLTQQVVEYSHYKADDVSYKTKNLFVPLAEPLKLELESFVESIRKRRAPEVTGEDGLKALEVALQCLQKNR